MLELIFQGFVEWIYGMVLEAWEYFASSLLDIMSMDFSYLEQHIAIIPIIRQSMLAVGWAILLGNLIFQASRSMLSGLGFEGEPVFCRRRIGNAAFPVRDGFFHRVVYPF